MSADSTIERKYDGRLKHGKFLTQIEDLWLATEASSIVGPATEEVLDKSPAGRNTADVVSKHGINYVLKQWKIGEGAFLERF